MTTTEKAAQGKLDHPKLATWLKAYRATGQDAEITNKGTLWPLKAARAWTAYIAKK